MKPVLVCFGTVLLIPIALSVAFNSEPDDTEEAVTYDRSRRGWSMMRLGRGLQMLRLGKRMVPPPPPHSPQATPEQMRALLSSLVDESRNEMRRQPPLPRYGRELNKQALEELYALVGEAYLSRAVPHGYNRFKRSAAGGKSGFMATQQSKDDALSSSTGPRFGNYLIPLYKARPEKAVPVPRIGRHDVPDVVEQGARMSGDTLTSEDTSLDLHNSNDASSLVL